MPDDTIEKSRGLSPCFFELYNIGGQNMSNAVIIKDAVKRYGDFTALCGVSLDIHEG